MNCRQEIRIFHKNSPQFIQHFRHCKFLIISASVLMPCRSVLYLLHFTFAECKHCMYVFQKPLAWIVLEIVFTVWLQDEFLSLLSCKHLKVSWRFLFLSFWKRLMAWWFVLWHQRHHRSDRFQLLSMVLFNLRCFLHTTLPGFFYCVCCPFGFSFFSEVKSPHSGYFAAETPAQVLIPPHVYRRWSMISSFRKLIWNGINCLELGYCSFSGWNDLLFSHIFH